LILLGELTVSEYFSPGVYVEEIEIGVKPIEGASTDTAGMVGVTENGPLNTPTLITSFPEFTRVFGSYLNEDYGEDRYLPHAVEGFFQNGGRRVYISRVEATSDTSRDERYIGVDDSDPKKRTALQALKNVDEISIIAIPNGTSHAIQHAMIRQCEQNMDRFAVLDSEKDSDLDKIQRQRSRYDSKNAALYYPWLVVSDPFSNGRITIPPSGHICGIYARSDMIHGVHKAPANEIIQGVVGLERRITKGQQEILNPLGINCLREFRSRGIQVWGARTISSDQLWKYVNVRRLFLYLEESLEKGTQWVVFEPNDEPLWSQIRLNVRTFMQNLFRQGVFRGTTPKEAYFVKCDRETTTDADIDRGIVNILVGFAPLKPAEFVILRIQHLAGQEAK
jgi:phage tail sheath protein FI